MRFCKYCGNQIDDDAKVCSKCGNKVEEFQPTQPAKSKKNQFGIAAFVIGILGFIPAIFSVLFADYAFTYFAWFGVSLVFAIVGIVKGVKNHQKIGLAIAGLILTAIDLVITIYFLYFI